MTRNFDLQLMKKDIEIKPVKDVKVTIAKEDGWKVYLLNRGESKLENVLVTSRGYGKKKGEEQKTSLLRHAIPYVDPGMHALIEPIDESVFHLNNEYWVSYYIDGHIYDKKFIFVPDTIQEKNLIDIPELNAKGVLHD